MKTIAARMLAKMTERLQQLIQQGCAYRAHLTSHDVSEGNYHEWRLASASFLKQVLGTKNDYYEFFNARATAYPTDRAKCIEEGLGILRAVKGEIEFGPLPHIESLVSGEIFDDFMDMAEHLLVNNYIQVVPSLVGAVLEDALRRIAQAHDVPLKRATTLGL